MSQRQFVPTTHQQAIADAVRNGEKNVAIDAGAGSGKTSTLLWLIETVLPQTSKILMCVFNTRNKDEIAGKLKKRGISNASAKTFNGMAYSAFLKRYNIKDTNRDMDMDTNKYPRLIRWWVSKNFTEGSRTTEQLADIREWLKGALHLFMVNTTRDYLNGDLVLFVGGGLRDGAATIPHATDAESIMTVLNRYPLPDLDNAEDYALCLSGVADLIRMGKLCIDNPRAAAMQLGLDNKERPINQAVTEGRPWLDFADQVYWCVVDSWNVWQNPIVLVDEAQDLSPLQRALVNMHVYRRGRVIMVGDPQQAINAWNGADNDGFTNSLTFWYVPKANTLALPICFRCFKEVCQLASDWKPGFTAAPDAPSGEIATINNVDLPKLVKEGDALIGRTRASCVQWMWSRRNARNPHSLI